MPVKSIVRAASGKQGPVGYPNANTIRVNPTTDELVFGTGTSGTTEKTVADTSSTQTFTGKTLTAPTISAPLMTGLEQENALSAAAASVVTVVKSATLLADAAATDFGVACVVTVPNANHAASVQIDLHASLGDQDSAQASYFTIAISRIAGAAAKAVVSAIGNAANTAGVTANAAGLITVVVAGAVGAVNTINIKVTVTRSAGASTNHDAVARITLINVKGTGATIA